MHPHLNDLVSDPGYICCRCCVLLKYMPSPDPALLPRALSSFGPGFYFNPWGYNAPRGKSWDLSETVEFEMA